MNADRIALHRCQLCNHSDLRPFIVQDGARLLRCPQCNLFQYGIVVETAQYEEEYHSGYVRHSPRKVRTASVRLNRIAGTLQRDSVKMLDIGCSIGDTLAAAEERGWRAIGVDVSQTAVASCQARGFEAVQIDRSRLPFRENEFDVITAWHVIEHVDDVQEALLEWMRVLTPGGVLALETPDASSLKVRLLGNRYRRFWTAEHTYTFSPKTLGAFLHRTGFEGVRRPFFGPLGTLGPGQAVYAVAYRTQLGVKKALGISKAFQLFARKPLLATPVLRAA